MSTSKLLGLPPISPELKPIIPYLQRADELVSQEPIVAYWCAYYAAQVGISIKARDTPSRELLFSLLTVLERMKNEIGPTDAIDMEEASAAYVENFALKVFAMADNEDRAGRSTRSTAKKFLAAANFLEVLRTFPKSDVSESNDEKVRYAKWKAADIAKAFREGRKPTPGPAGSGIEEQHPELLPPPMNISTSASSPHNIASTQASPPRTPPTRLSVSPPKHYSPPTPHFDHNGIARANVPHMSGSLPPRAANLHPTHPWDGDVTPGSWSTAATPGTTASHGANTTATHWDQHSPRPKESRRESQEHIQKRHKSRSGSGSSLESTGSGNVGASKGVLKKKAYVSEELEGKSSPPLSSSPSRRGRSPTLQVNNYSDPAKKVHFTPSVAGGSTTAGSPPPSPQQVGYQGPSSIYANMPKKPSPETETIGPFPTSGSPPHPQNQHTGLPAASSSSPRNLNIYAPLPTNARTSAPVLPPNPPPAADLTPGVIAKAQKHCRFAISALDYEDGEQARKELRAALAILGG